MREYKKRLITRACGHGGGDHRVRGRDDGLLTPWILAAVCRSGIRSRERGGLRFWGTRINVSRWMS